MKRATFLCFLMSTFIACQPEKEFNDSKYQLVYDTYTESTFQYVEISDGSEILESPVIEFVEVDDDRDYGFSIIREYNSNIYTVSTTGKSIRVYPIEENGTINPTLSRRFWAEGNGPGEYNEIFGLTFIDSTLFLHDGPKFKVNSYDPNFNHIHDYLIKDIRPSLGDFISIDDNLIFTQSGIEDFKLIRYDTDTEISSLFFEKLIKRNYEPRIYNSLVLHQFENELFFASRHLPFLYIFSDINRENNHPDYIVRLGTSKLEMIGKASQFDNFGGINSMNNPLLVLIEPTNQYSIGGTPAIQSLAVNKNWIFTMASEGNQIIALNRTGREISYFGTFGVNPNEKVSRFPFLHIVRNKLYLTNNSNTIAIIDLDRLYDTYK